MRDCPATDILNLEVHSSLIVSLLSGTVLILARQLDAGIDDRLKHVISGLHTETFSLTWYWNVSPYLSAVWKNRAAGFPMYVQVRSGLTPN